jgi:hypothetical protein
MTIETFDFEALHIASKRIMKSRPVGDIVILSGYRKTADTTASGLTATQRVGGAGVQKTAHRSPPH